MNLPFVDIPSIHIEIVYACPEHLTHLSCSFIPPVSVEDALLQSDFLKLHPELSLNHLVVGIFGERVSLQQALKHHDRIEIYRPLVMDPKTRRRLKHQEKQRRSLKTT